MMTQYFALKYPFRSSFWEAEALSRKVPPKAGYFRPHSSSFFFYCTR